MRTRGHLALTHSLQWAQTLSVPGGTSEQLHRVGHGLEQHFHANPCPGFEKQGWSQRILPLQSYAIGLPPASNNSFLTRASQDPARHRKKETQILNLWINVTSNTEPKDKGNFRPVFETPAFVASRIAGKGREEEGCRAASQTCTEVTASAQSSIHQHSTHLLSSLSTSHPHTTPTLPRRCSHRIVKWSGLERTLKIISFQLPAMGRDTFH